MIASIKIKLATAIRFLYIRIFMKLAKMGRNKKISFCQFSAKFSNVDDASRSVNPATSVRQQREVYAIDKELVL